MVPKTLSYEDAVEYSKLNTIREAEKNYKIAKSNREEYEKAKRKNKSIFVDFNKDPNRLTHV